MGKQEFVKSVVGLGEGRAADRSGDTDNGTHLLRKVRKVHEELQDVARALGIADEDERHVRAYRPLFQVLGNLPGVVGRSRSASDDNRIDAVATVAERVYRRPEWPGVFPEALAERARHEQHLQPRLDSRLSWRGFGRFVIKPMQPEVTRYR
jgi:hypothetical protein